MSALPTINRGANIADKVAFEKALNPYPEALPDSVSNLWNARMKSFMELFIKHSEKNGSEVVCRSKVIFTEK